MHCYSCSLTSIEAERLDGGPACVQVGDLLGKGHAPDHVGDAVSDGEGGVAPRLLGWARE